MEDLLSQLKISRSLRVVFGALMMETRVRHSGLLGMLLPVKMAMMVREVEEIVRHRIQLDPLVVAES